MDYLLFKFSPTGKNMAKITRPKYQKFSLEQIDELGLLLFYTWLKLSKNKLNLWPDTTHDYVWKHFCDKKIKTHLPNKLNIECTHDWSVILQICCQVAIKFSKSKSAKFQFQKMLLALNACSDIMEVFLLQEPINMDF